MRQSSQTRKKMCRAESFVDLLSDLDKRRNLVDNGNF